MTSLLIISSSNQPDLSFVPWFIHTLPNFEQKIYLRLRTDHNRLPPHLFQINLLTNPTVKNPIADLNHMSFEYSVSGKNKTKLYMLNYIEPDQTSFCSKFPFNMDKFLVFPHLANFFHKIF